MLLATWAQTYWHRTARRHGMGNPVVDRGTNRCSSSTFAPNGPLSCLELWRARRVIIEGLRPGVMERLGWDRRAPAAESPSGVRPMTGWGQDGPLARAAGHDINLHCAHRCVGGHRRTRAAAIPPLNLVGDFGGGSMFLTWVVLAALLERERSGQGRLSMPRSSTE